MSKTKRAVVVFFVMVLSGIGMVQGIKKFIAFGWWLCVPAVCGVQSRTCQPSMICAMRISQLSSFSVLSEMKRSLTSGTKITTVTDVHQSYRIFCKMQPMIRCEMHSM